MQHLYAPFDGFLFLCGEGDQENMILKHYVQAVDNHNFMHYYKWNCFIWKFLISHRCSSPKDPNQYKEVSSSKWYYTEVRFHPMMTSSNGTIFRVTGHFCGEYTGHQWIPHTQRLVTRSFDVFFDLHINKRLITRWWGCWFETLSCSLWRHCNAWMAFSLPS